MEIKFGSFTPYYTDKYHTQADLAAMRKPLESYGMSVVSLPLEASKDLHVNVAEADGLHLKVAVLADAIAKAVGSLGYRKPTDLLEQMNAFGFNADRVDAIWKRTYDFRNSVYSALLSQPADPPQDKTSTPPTVDAAVVPVDYTAMVTEAGKTLKAHIINMREMRIQGASFARLVRDGMEPGRPENLLGMLTALQVPEDRIAAVREKTTALYQAVLVALRNKG